MATEVTIVVRLEADEPGLEYVLEELVLDIEAVAPFASVVEVVDIEEV